MNANRSRIANAAVLVPAMIALHFSVDAGAARERWVADPPTLRGTVTQSIGGADDDRPEYEFGYIAGLTFDAKGQVFVSDATANKIRVYSPEGKHLFAIGQRGAGPGDVNDPRDISLAADGKLWVRDYRNHRFQLFDAVPPMGKSLRVVPFLTGDVAGDNVHWDSEGHVVEVTHTKSTRPGESFRTMRNFLDDRGTVVATDTAPVISPDSAESWTFTTTNGSSTAYKPLGMRRIMAFGGAGYAAYATNSVYAVRLVDAKGRQVALLRRSVTGAALNAVDADSTNALVAMIAKNRSVTPSSLNFVTPKRKPVIAQMWFDLDGRLWIERSVVTGASHEADVYDRAGKWVAVMQWPNEVQLRLGAVRGSSGMGVARDADGVQRVVRMAWK